METKGEKESSFIEMSKDCLQTHDCPAQRGGGVATTTLVFHDRQVAAAGADGDDVTGLPAPAPAEIVTSHQCLTEQCCPLREGRREGNEGVVLVMESHNAVITMESNLPELNDVGTDGKQLGSHREFAHSTHCHIQPKESGVDKKARFRLILASILCLFFMTGEIVGGFLAHSLAVVSDAAHLLTDFASFMISLVALYLVSRPATKRLSFGWHRAEIIGALISILMLWLITGVLVYTAVLRIQSGDYEIDAKIMLITSATGVLFNIILACTLSQHGHSHGGLSHGHSHDSGSQEDHEGHSHGNHEGHSHGNHEGHGHSHDGPGHSHGSHGGAGHSHTSAGHSHDEDHSHSFDGHHETSQRVPLLEGSVDKGFPTGGYGSLSNGVRQPALGKMGDKKTKGKGSNINVKAAFIHVIGDFCQSVGVLVAAFIIYFKPEWKIADPICTFVFSLLVLITTINIMRDILMVLMEGTPRNLNFEEVRDFILDIPGVKDLHDLRLWSLTMNKTALSVHLAVEKGVDPMRLVRAVSHEIQHKYKIHQTTMQVEEYEDEMSNCRQCQDLKG